AMDHGQPLSEPIPGTNVPLDRLLASPISTDGQFAQASLVFTQDFDAIPKDAVAQMQQAVAPATKAGVQVAFGGEVVDALSTDSGGLSQYADLIGLGLAVIILLVALGSVTGMAVPLINALFSLMVSSMAVVLLEARFEIGSVAPIIATTIGLGVGIDYSLFIVSRYRQNLGRGMSVEDAVGNAIATSGSSVLFAAITVCIALVGLFVIGIPYITWLGIVAALFVAVTVCSALTLLPAVLGLLGPKIDALRLPWHKPAEEETDEAMRASFSARWAGAIAKRPAIFTVVTLVILLALAFPLVLVPQPACSWALSWPPA
ncbi:MAG TPA: MMPL family transporter, partial [Marmoricola sp.]|nr:MMPL family transporter [Marmoricola sp.]